MREHHGDSIEKGLYYHDYALMLAYLDVEWSRPAEGNVRGAYLQSAELFLESCCRYATALQDNAHRWVATRPDLPPEAALFDACLFKPRGWVPFGSADMVYGLLVDDMDAAQTIVEYYPRTVEEVSLAFCPNMTSLGATAEDGCFVEPDHFFRKLAKDAGETGTKVAADVYLDSNPLFVVARFKMESLLTVGRALCCQGALFQLMVQKLRQKLEECRAELAADPGLEVWYSARDLDSLKISFLDLQDEEEIAVIMSASNYTVCMQMVGAMRNLMVKDLLAADTGGLLKTELNRCMERLDEGSAEKHVPDLITSVFGPGAKLGNLVENGSGAHLFRWSRTSLCMTQAVYERAKERPGDPIPGINGWLSANVGVQISPGHCAAVQATIHRALDKVAPRGTAPAPGLPASFLLAGIPDLLFDAGRALQPAAGHGTGERTCLVPGELMPSEQLARLCEAVLLVQEEVSENLDEGEHESFSRHITGWTSHVHVPLPTMASSPRQQDDHRPIFNTLLKSFVQYLFPERLYPVPPHPGVYSFRKLRDLTRMCGLPVALRRSLIYLFENYGAVLSNPRLFEVVLDHSNSLGALYMMLTESLPEEAAGRNFNDVEHPPFFGSRMPRPHVDQLSDLLEALNSSLELRLTHVYPEEQLRDSSLDFRSNLSQLLGAAEATLRTATGFFAQCTLRYEEDKDAVNAAAGHGSSRPPGKGDIPPPDRANYDKRGAIKPDRQAIVFRLVFRPGIVIKAVTLMTKRKDRPRLAVCEADVLHLLNLRSFCNFFHETYHLVHHEKFPFSELKDRLNKHPNEPYRLEALHGEMFVQFLMLLTVFDGDEDLMIRDFCHRWSVTLENTAPDGQGERPAPPQGKQAAPTGRRAPRTPHPDTTRKNRDLNSFAENFTPVVIAIICHRVVRKQPSPLPDRKTRRDLQKELPGPFDAGLLPDIKDALRLFDQCLETGRPFLADHEWFFPEDNPSAREKAVELVHKSFAHIYYSLFHTLEEAWKAAEGIFDRFISDAGFTEHSQPRDTRWMAYRQHLKNVDDHIKDIYLIPRSGAQAASPLMKRLFCQPVAGCHTQQPEGPATNDIVLVLRILRGYLRMTYEWPLDTDSDGAPLAGIAKNGLKKKLRHVLDRPMHQHRAHRLQGQVEFREPYAYGAFLIDRLAASPFCCLPSARRRRLGADICTIKMLWDVGSRQRRRRFRDLLHKVALERVEANRLEEERQAATAAWQKRQQAIFARLKANRQKRLASSTGDGRRRGAVRGKR